MMGKMWQISALRSVSVDITGQNDSTRTGGPSISMYNYVNEFVRKGERERLPSLGRSFF